jgi:hypothetical protein
MKADMIIEETSPSLIWDSKYGNKNVVAETAKEEKLLSIQNILSDNDKVNEENKKKEDEKTDEIETIK